MFGYSASEMLGRPITVLLPPDRLNEEEHILRRLKAGEKVDHFETVRVRKDGRLVHVSVTISPIRDPNGQVIGASKIARDISDKKALEAKQLLTASVFTHTNEGIVVLDSHGAVVEANPAFTHITGYGRDELLGLAARQFVAQPDMAEWLLAITDALTANGHYQGEHWCRRKDQRKIALLLTVSVVRSAEGDLQNYVALLSDITPLRVRQERLEHLAHHDALTNLPNRVLLDDRIRQSLILARRHGFNVAVLFIDLDGFKQVNDQWGHAAGDTVLVALAQRMKAALREVDTLARIGGDEFAAVLADVKGMEECHPLLQRLLNACATPVALGAQQVRLSASIGVAIYPQHDVPAEQLLSHADHALYQAKQSGKNRYQVFGG
jgi:diguanylate cyclase (GGDEF)-like protein/PAS domain S-box-containing protein